MLELVKSNSNSIHSHIVLTFVVRNGAIFLAYTMRLAAQSQKPSTASSSESDTSISALVAIRKSLFQWCAVVIVVCAVAANAMSCISELAISFPAFLVFQLVSLPALPALPVFLVFQLIGITQLCRGKKGNDISGRYTLIGCRLVTKISQVEINPQRVFFREF